MAGNAPKAGLFVALRGSVAEFDKAMSKAATNFQKFSRKVDAVGRQLTVGLSTTIVGLSAGIIRSTQALDDAFDNIRVTTGKTGDALKGLNEDFRSVFKRVPDDANKVSTAIGTLNAKLGLTGKPLQDMAVQLLNVSRITNTDLNANVNASAQLFNQWKVATDQQSGALDTLFKIAQATNTPFTALVEETTKLGPAARAAGFDITQTAAILGQLNKAGIDAAVASGGLTIAFKKLSALGVKDVSGALQKMILDIKNAGSASAASAMGVQLFGKAGLRMADAIRSGALSTGDFIKAINASQETINGAYDDTKGFAELWGTLKNQVILAAEPFEGAMTEALKKLQPAFEKLAATVAALATWFSNLSPETQAAAIALLAVGAGIGPALVAFASFVQVGAQLLFMLGKLGPAVALLLTPFGAFVALLGAAIVMLKTEAFARGLEIIRVAIVNFGTALQQNFLAGMEKVTTQFARSKDLIVQAANDIYNGVRDALVTKFQTIYQDFGKGLDVIYDAFANLKSRLLDQSPVPEIKEGIEKNFAEASDSMVASTKTGTEVVDQLWGKLNAKMKGHAAGAKAEATKVATALENAFDKIEKAARDAGDPLDTVSQKIRDLILAKDVNALKAYARELIKGEKSARMFFRAFEKGKDAAKDTKDRLKDVIKSISGIKESAEEAAGKVSELQKQVNALVDAGDVGALEEMAKAFATDEQKLSDFNEAVQKAPGQLDKLKQAGLEAAKQVTTAFGGLAVALGAPEDGIAALTAGFDKIIELVGKTETEMDKLGSFADAFDNFGSLLSGDFESIDLEKFGNELAAIADTAGNILGPLLAMGSDGGANDLQQGVTGGLAAIGAVVGAYYGGPSGAAAGSSLGASLGSLIPGLTDTDAPDHDARKTVEQYLEDFFKNKQTQFYNSQGNLQPFDGNILRGNESAFDDPGWADAFHAMGAEAEGTFTALGTALKELLGVTEDVGAQIGFILASTFSGNVDNARLLVQQLKLNFEDLQNALLEGAISGRMSWHEFEVELQNLSKAFEPGRAAVADIDGAMDALKQSGGRGVEAIKSLRDIAIEAGEAGIKTLDQLKEHLLASGKYSADQIEALFTALKQRGITSLEALINSSDRTAGGIVADMESLGFQFDKVAEAIDKGAETLEKWPDHTEKEIEINVRTNFDENTQKAIDEGLLDGGSSGGAASSGEKSLTTGGSDVIGKLLPTTSARTSSSSSSGKGKSSSSKSKVSAAKARALEDLRQRNQVITQLKDTFGSNPLPGFGGDEKTFKTKDFEKRLKAWSAQFKTLSADSQSFFKGLAANLAATNNLSASVAAQLAKALGATFGGSINAARQLVGALNLDFDSTIDAIVELARTNQITWPEMADMVDAVTQAFKPGIEGVGNYSGAIDQFWLSEGKGFAALQGVRNLAIEGVQAGITTLDDLREKLIAAGKPIAQVDAFIKAAKDRITQFSSEADKLPKSVHDIVDALQSGDVAKLQGMENTAVTNQVDAEKFYSDLQAAKEFLASVPSELSQLAEAPDVLAGQIIADALKNGFVFASAPPTGKKGQNTPATQALTYNPTSAQTSGGTSTSGSGATGKSGPAVVYNLDLRGAGKGVGEEVKRALREVHDSAVRDAVRKVRDISKRGGRIADL